MTSQELRSDFERQNKINYIRQSLVIDMAIFIFFIDGIFYYVPELNTALNSLDVSLAWISTYWVIFVAMIVYGVKSKKFDRGLTVMSISILVATSTKLIEWLYLDYGTEVEFYTHCAGSFALYLVVQLSVFYFNPKSIGLEDGAPEKRGNS